MDVIVQHIVGVGDLVLVGAVVVALALVCPHHALGEDLSVVAAEAHVDGAGQRGRAAAPVRARSTPARFVPTHAGAAGVAETQSLPGLLHPETSLALL